MNAGFLDIFIHALASVLFFWALGYLFDIARRKIRVLKMAVVAHIAMSAFLVAIINTATMTKNTRPSLVLPLVICFISTHILARSEMRRNKAQIGMNEIAHIDKEKP